LSLLLIFNQPDRLAPLLVDYRSIPIVDWIPRWMNPWYDTTSDFRKLYYLGICQPLKEIERVITNDTYPDFWGSTGQARITYTAKYSTNLTHLPTDFLYNFVGVDPPVLVPKDSYGSMMVELVSPCYYFADGMLVLKNLSMSKTPLVITVSGYLDLSEPFSLHPPIPDTYYIVRNAYGDDLYIDPTDTRLYGSKIYLNLGGHYEVYYLAQDIHDNLVSGVDYISISSTEKLDLFVTYVPNVWDRYGEMLGVHRIYGENNIAYKERIRQLAFLKRPEQRISARMGQSTLASWDMATTYTFPVTGVGYVSVIDPLIPFQYIQESPVKIGTNFLLTFIPSGYVQLYYKGLSVQTDSYVVSGSLIMPNSINIQNADASSLVAYYKIVNYTTSSTGGYLNTLVNNSPTKASLIIYSKSVTMSSTTKKIKNWYWDKETSVNNTLKGLSSFN